MVHHKKTHGVSLLEKELGEVRSVLAGDAGDEGDLSVLVGGDFSRHVDGVWVAGKMVEMTLNELGALTIGAMGKL